MDNNVIQYDELHGIGVEIPSFHKGHRGYRQYFLTINNPQPVFSHERIKEILSKLNLKYWCMADEIGSETGTYHTHLFWQSKHTIRWDTVKHLFNTAHFNRAFGKNYQSRNYILKVDEYAHKSDTSVEGTFEEWGEFIPERQGKRNDWTNSLDLLDEGNTVYEIIREFPQMAKHENTLGRLREMIIEEQYREVERELEVVYVQGETGLGKTTHITKKYGHSNICRITNYKHGCFNKYKCEDVMVFEEFASKFDIEDMLVYLDKYPLELPCKYYNKVACYNKVYIISNLPLEKQYADVKAKNREVYDAFLRRITKVMVFTDFCEFVEFETTGAKITGDEILAADKYFKAVSDNTLFDKQSEIFRSGEQSELEDFDFDDM